MERPTPAQQLESGRAALQWAQQIQADQPDSLLQTYQQAADEIVRALTQEIYRFSLQLPHILYHNGVLISIPAQWVMLRAGTPLDVLRRRSCAPKLTSRLINLAHNSFTAISVITCFVAYLAARRLLFDHIPTVEQIDCQVYFDASGQLQGSAAAARAGVEQLSDCVRWMHRVEQLYPGWAASDEYSEKYSHLIVQLTAQGRSLANYETGQMIDEILTYWRSGDPLRGLTLTMPYLDERTYLMRDYRVVVVPTSRIPFRPEFVLGACRVEQQRVRKNPQLSQATRWQLISQLDAVLQAFEKITSETPGTFQKS